MLRSTQRCFFSVQSGVVQKRLHSGGGCCHWFQPETGKENIWQIDMSTIKYGNGALKELGMDANQLGMKTVAFFTDKYQRELDHVQTAIKALESCCDSVVVYDDVQIEPTDNSLRDAIKFASSYGFDGFVSVGGGSVIDTCKAANAYSTYPANDIFEYITPPVGRGTKIPGKLRPHIACPTTCGTGSESTGIAIFDITELKLKTGVAQRALRPSLAVIDPVVTHTLPKAVIAASAFDVLSHACESYTARPFTSKPAPKSADLRPMSQGSNPWSDAFCIQSLSLCGSNIIQAVNNENDLAAREQLMMAATLAGVAFGNAGVHIPHGMSYSVSGLIHHIENSTVRDYLPEGYPSSCAPMVPHGFSVILNAPAAFRWTSDACPERHLEAAKHLGAPAELCDKNHLMDLSIQAGDILALRIENLMKACGVPNGLSGVGYTRDHSAKLAATAIRERRLLENAPKIPNERDLEMMFNRSMQYW